MCTSHRPTEGADSLTSGQVMILNYLGNQAMKAEIKLAEFLVAEGEAPDVEHALTIIRNDIDGLKERWGYR